MINIGLIGYGRWGPNLARCLATTPSIALMTICDHAPARLLAAKHAHCGARLESDWRAVISDSQLAAIAIATPALTHFEIAIAALEAGKHLLLEKPMACSSTEASRLVEASQRRGLVLTIDHTWLFSPFIRELRDMLGRGQVGRAVSYRSTRSGANGCKDVNVIWDLAVHDLAIIDYLLSSEPAEIRVTGTSSTPYELEDRARLELSFSNSLTAEICVAWNAQTKCRHIQIDGNDGSLIFDDINQTAKLRIIGPSANAASLGVESFSPSDSAKEPLRNLVEHFAECIATGRRPITDGIEGLRVVRLLEAADQSLKANGLPIEVFRATKSRPGLDNAEPRPARP